MTETKRSEVVYTKDNWAVVVVNQYPSYAWAHHTCHPPGRHHYIPSRGYGRTHLPVRNATRGFCSNCEEVCPEEIRTIVALFNEKQV